MMLAAPVRTPINIDDCDALRFQSDESKRKCGLIPKSLSTSRHVVIYALDGNAMWGSVSLFGSGLRRAVFNREG